MRRIVWIKALLAAVPATLFLAAPAPVVHADGACTALANDYDAYNECVFKEHVYCKTTGDPWFNPTLTCKYSDGGRDECLMHFVPFSGGKVADHSCTYVPAGAESAPPAGAAPEPAPAGEPAPSQP